jgi:hypothetical protein
MTLARLPLFERLGPAKNVLVAGAGGGFDVYAGLPLFFALEAQGKRVHLANLSFADLSGIDARALSPHLATVTADSPGDDRYFPEKHLAAWFRAEEDREVAVHAFQKVGVRPLSEAYRNLVRHLGVDAIVLVDGGTDSLMRGDEAGLGTPVEDAASLAAAAATDVPIKLLACLGFGIDHFHGVAHRDVLEAIAELTRSGAFLGAFSVLGRMPEARRYLSALAWVHERAPLRPSIVNGSIASAIEGHFGDHHSTTRTAGSELFINPLMSLYFAFELGPVAERVLYRKAIAHTETAFEMMAIIEAFRAELTPKRRQPIPL